MKYLTDFGLKQYGISLKKSKVWILPILNLHI